MNFNICRYDQINIELGKDRITEDIWEAQATQHLSFEWNVVLSCCFNNLGNKCLENLLSITDTASLKYNFKNMHLTLLKNTLSVANTDFLQEIVSTFEMILKFNNAQTLDMKVNATSALLKCNILTITKLSNLDKRKINLTIKCIPQNTNFAETIILFLPEEFGATTSFGLTESRCLEIRDMTLKHIFENTNHKEIIIEFCQSVRKRGKSILIEMLKSDRKQIITEICNSPSIIFNLEKLGYDINPIMTDDTGCSPFYYAVISNDSKIYFSFYHFTISFSSNSSNSYRKPNAKILHHLTSLKKVLENDLMKFSTQDHPYDFKENIKHSFSGLISVTNFLVETSENILSINNKYTDSSRTPCQQRDIIVSILETYLKHFNSPCIENPDAHFENYIIYKYYCDMIDAAASLMFFDNIHLLREKIVLKDKHEYEHIESAFFISALSWITFKEQVEKYSNFDTFCHESENVPYKIILNVRESVVEKIRWFTDILKSTDINKNTLRDNVPPEEFQSLLDSYPEIKDYLLSERLIYYIDYASSITTFNDKTALTIQRILHVLGEYLTLPSKPNSCLWLLKVYVPTAAKTLKKLRNKLSHQNSKATNEILEHNRNWGDFQSVISEIIQIHENLKPFFNFLKLRVKNYIERKLNTISVTDQCKKVMEKHVPDIIKNILDEQNQVFKKQSSNQIHNYAIVFKNILEYSYEKYNHKISIISESQNVIEEIRDTFEPLKLISKCMLDDIEQHPEKLQKIYKNIENMLRLDDINILIKKIDDSEELFKNFVSEMEVGQTGADSTEREKKKMSIVHIENFLTALKKGPSIFSIQDKILIKNLVPKIPSNDLEKKENIKLSIENNFVLSEKEINKYKLSYLTKTEWKRFIRHYKSKAKEFALNIIKTPNERIDEILFRNRIDKKTFEYVRTVLQLSEKPNLLDKFRILLKGAPKTRRQKLSVLQAYVQKLKSILILDGEILKNENLNSNEERVLQNEIISYCKNNLDVQFSTEILLYYCLNLFPVHHYFRKKMSLLYTGIDVRNVLAHGHIILEELSEFLDPHNFESEIVKDALSLIKDEDCISEMSKLYNRLGKNKHELIKHIKIKQPKSIVECVNYEKYLDVLLDQKENE